MKKSLLTLLVASTAVTGIAFAPIISETYSPKTNSKMDRPYVEITTNPTFQNQHSDTALINSNFIDAIIKVESKGNPKALGKNGDRGLMQITPIVLKEWNQKHPKEQYTLSDLFAPEINTKIGTWYLTEIDEYCSRNHPSWSKTPISEKRKIIIAGYNGGKARLKSKKWKIEKMPKITRTHLEKLQEVGAFN